MCNSEQIETLDRDALRRFDHGQTESDRVGPDEIGDDGDFDGLDIDEDDDTDELFYSASEAAAILDESRAYAADMDSLPGWPTDAEIAGYERHYCVKAA